MSTSVPLRARLGGALRHPLRTANVVAYRLRESPAQLAVAVGRIVPDGPATRAAGRLAAALDPTRAEAGPSAGVARAWREGHWLDALAATPSGSRQRARYEGEIAALRPDGIPLTRTGAVTSRPGRVLHAVTNALPYTVAGYTVRTHKIVLAQRDAGLDPVVVTRWGWPALQGVFGAASEQVVDGVPYRRLLPRGVVPLRADVRLARNADDLTALVRELRPAVVHAATPHLNGTPALAAARRTGLPFVYEARGFLEDTWASEGEGRHETDRYRLTRARETALMREADAVVTIARTMRDDIVARGVDRDRVVVVPNCVDAGLLDARPDGAAFRRRLGIGADELVVGSVSSMKAYEGFATLVEAAALLRERGTPVRVLLVGDGDERPVLRDTAARLGLGDAVLLPGRVPPEEAPDAMAALDVLCVPRTDTQVCRTVTPLKPVEAMALGVPVVASDLPALSEVLADGRAGALVPPDDPASLADALAALCADPGRREALTQAGRAEVVARRTWQAAARAYRDLYGSLGVV